MCCPVNRTVNSDLQRDNTPTNSDTLPLTFDTNLYTFNHFLFIYIYVLKVLLVDKTYIKKYILIKIIV